MGLPFFFFALIVHIPPWLHSLLIILLPIGPLLSHSYLTVADTYLHISYFLPYTYVLGFFMLLLSSWFSLFVSRAGFSLLGSNSLVNLAFHDSPTPPNG